MDVLLLTDNTSPGLSDGMIPGFPVEAGGMEKLVIVAISLIYRKHVTVRFVYIKNISVISVENAL